MQDLLSSPIAKAYLFLGCWFWVVSVVVLVRRWREREQATSTNKLTIPRQVTRRAFALIGALVVVVAWLPLLLWHTAVEVFPDWTSLEGECHACNQESEYWVRTDKLEEGVALPCKHCKVINRYGGEEDEDESG
jgi:hypothetical protein